MNTLGTEGIDNDGDGLINEDPPGGYDMNRNWPADWQPEHVQGGAGDFPLSWPETNCVALFILDHPNIAGVQSFHNAGGMILRGPGSQSRQAAYPGNDDRIAEEIGAVGARMIPFYRNMVIWRDLYSVHGGFVNWTYEHRGIFSFTNELWNTDQMLGTARPAGANPARRWPTRSSQNRTGQNSSSPTTSYSWARPTRSGSRPSIRSMETSRSADSSRNRSESRRAS